MEMTRQRAQVSLSSTTYDTCPYCDGRGMIKSAETMSIELQRALHAVMRKHRDTIHEFRVAVHPEVMKRLRTEDEEHLVDIERRYEGRLTFVSDPSFHRETFVITDAATGNELKG
jgi:ribonuclease G